MNRIAFITLLGLSAACSPAGIEKAPATAAATGCAGGIVLRDAELQTYRGCRAISGDLELSGVTSLAPLATLRSVHGTLRIENASKLYTLEGLERLRSVGALEIHHNASLISAGALRQLKQASHVSISHNPRLSTKYGLLDGMRRSGVAIDLAANWGLVAEGVRAPAQDQPLAAR